MGKDTGAAIALPLLATWTYVAFYLCIQVLISVLAKLSNRTAYAQTRFENRTYRILRKKLVPVTVALFFVALLFAYFYYSYHSLFQTELVSQQQNYLRAGLLLQAIPFWLGVARLFTVIWISARLLIKYLRRHCHIQLFEIERLYPISQLVQFYILGPSIMFLLVPLFWINSRPPLLDMNLVFFTASLFIVLVSYPIFSVHQILQRKKTKAVSRINHNIALVLSNQHKQSKRLGQQKARTQYIADLYTIRNGIHEADVWPISLPLLLRSVSLVLLPVLVWLANACLYDLFQRFWLETPIS